MKTIIRELKEAKEKGLRKFELVDGSFQELGALVAHLVESVGVQALWSPERWRAPETP